MAAFVYLMPETKKAETRAVIVILIVASRATIEGTVSRVVPGDFSDVEISTMKSCECIARRALCEEVP